MKILVHSCLLIAVTAVWGWTFVVVRDAVAVYSVMGFLTWRFAIAGLSLAVICRKQLTLKTLRAGMFIGIVLAAGYILQTTGLRFTRPSNSGLITGLFVVFAPLADRLLFGVRPARTALLAMLTGLAGLFLLVGQSPKQLMIGDLLTLGCAVAFGLHISLLSRFSNQHKPGPLALGQITGATIIFAVLWPLCEPVVFPPKEVWPALLITGLLASALAFYVQALVQQYLSAARAAVILIMEPVFAALFGYWLAGDRLSPVQWTGAFAIFMALIVGEVLPVLFRKKKSPEEKKAAAGVSPSDAC